MRDLLQRSNENLIHKIKLDRNGKKMNFNINYIIIIELIGTVAFALSGSIVAVQKNLDLFGTIVLGVITAVGGGMIRDIIIGITPPLLFINPIYVLVACVTAIVFFFLCFMNKKIVYFNKTASFGKWLNMMDTIGLGVFTVVGVNTPIQLGLEKNAFLCIVVGVTTGIGGGILRDILAMRTPVVLQKHVYAVASIVGAIIYFYTQRVLMQTYAVLIGIGVVILLRICATYFEWNLPRISQD